jgi:hypothetical protein
MIRKYVRYQDDNDGFSNFREYLSGSDPKNDNDRPSILADYESDNDVDGNISSRNSAGPTATRLLSLARLTSTLTAM